MQKRGYHVFPLKLFCPTVPKNFVGQSFGVSLISSIKKVWIREGEYQDFPSEIFCLTVPKNFVGESFKVSLISAIEELYVSEGYVTNFDLL